MSILHGTEINQKQENAFLLNERSITEHSTEDTKKKLASSLFDTCGKNAKIRRQILWGFVRTSAAFTFFFSFLHARAGNILSVQNKFVKHYGFIKALDLVFFNYYTCIHVNNKKSMKEDIYLLSFKLPIKIPMHVTFSQKRVFLVLNQKGEQSHLLVN